MVSHLFACQHDQIFMQIFYMQWAQKFDRLMSVINLFIY